jgi:hypothetical protein
MVALQYPTTADSWTAFVHALPRPEPTRLTIDVDEPGIDPAPAGMRLPLAPLYAQIATTGTYPADRYPSPSEARAAVLLHALHRGWTSTDIATAVGSGHWAGLAGLYRTKYGRRYADKSPQRRNRPRPRPLLRSPPAQTPHQCSVPTGGRGG